MEGSCPCALLGVLRGQACKAVRGAGDANMNVVSGEVSLSLILCGALKYKLQHWESLWQGKRPFAPLAATTPECMCVWGRGVVGGGGADENCVAALMVQGQALDKVAGMNL